MDVDPEVVVDAPATEGVEEKGVVDLDFTHLTTATQEYGGCGPGPAQGGPGTGGQGQSGPGPDGNGWSKPAFPTEVNPPPPPATKELNAEEEEVAVVALIATPGIQKAESVGLLLSADAITAILTIPATHASELLETVSARHESLRDPSNYIVSTISKGYVPKGPQY